MARDFLKKYNISFPNKDNSLHISSSFSFRANTFNFAKNNSISLHLLITLSLNKLFKYPLDAIAPFLVKITFLISNNISSNSFICGREFSLLISTDALKAILLSDLSDNIISFMVIKLLIIAARSFLIIFSKYSEIILL